MEDSTILEAFRTGTDEQEAFDFLFRRFYAKMCAYAVRFVDRNEAEDIVQECFVWLWNNRRNLFVSQSLSSYMFSMTAHRALNVCRKRSNGSRVVQMLQESLRESVDENSFDIDELGRRISEAIDSLPEDYRAAFTLHRFSDRTYREIAELYNMSPKTIDYRIQRALKILKEQLVEYLPLSLLAVVMRLMGN